MTVMDPNTQTVDPEEGGVEVDLNGSNDTMETEMPSSGVPVHDDWSESQGEDAVSSQLEEGTLLTVVASL